jgi:hypothetical protein
MQVLVASGIGITPALSCFESYRDDRRISVIWMCRDPDLVEFYLGTHIFEANPHGLMLVFYTGRAPLDVPDNLPESVEVIHERPDLPDVITRVITFTEELQRGDDCSGAHGHGHCRHPRPPPTHTHTPPAGLALVSHPPPARSNKQQAKGGESETAPLVPLLRGRRRARAPLLPLLQPMVAAKNQTTNQNQAPAIQVQGHSQAVHLATTAAAAPLGHANFRNSSNKVLPTSVLVPSKKKAAVVPAESSPNSSSAGADYPPESSSSNAGNAGNAGKQQQQRWQSYDLSKWGIMYCGGAASIVSQLNTFSGQNGVSLKCESFKW